MHLYIHDVGVGELEGRDAGVMVAFPEARKVSARRRHLHVNVGSCGAPAAGPRHGGRPARPPHHFAPAAPRVAAAARARAAATA